MGRCYNAETDNGRRKEQIRAVAWDSNVNTKILRSGTNWGEVQGFIENESLSGKTVRRFAHSMGKRQFSVTMRFSKVEYEYFRTWYKTTCFSGALSFFFPEIDTGSGTLKEYRFANGGQPKYNNPNGIIIECQMEWEEV